MGQGYARLGSMGTIADRFWKHVEIGEEGSCWMWRGAVQRGYGAVRLTFPGRVRRQVNANRVAFVLAYGPIETGDHVMHACDTPLCVNPAHLMVGSRSDNMRDSVEKGRFRAVGGSPRRLTPKEREGVGAALDDGEPIRAIARRFSTSPVTVRRYRSQRTGEMSRHGEML